MNRYPIVFVHGLLGWGRDKLLGVPYFGTAALAAAWWRLRRLSWSATGALFPSVGPISSNHDRACELFYRLKGGDVHYGEEHSRQHGHKETVQGWGTRARPLYPAWSRERPLHFVGQAQGASSVRVLQHLLAQGDFFRNPETGRPYPTSADWSRSITGISALHNGSPTAYILGCSRDTGLIEPQSTAEYVLQTLLSSESSPTLRAWLERRFYGLGLDQWTDLDAFRQGTDHAAFDLSIHGAQEAAGIADHPSTYYFSFLTSKTDRDPRTGHYVPRPDMNVFFRYIGEELGRFRGPVAGLRCPITDFEPWWENDGLAPVFSQEYPTWGAARIAVRPEPNGPFKPGVWNVMETLDMDHMEPVALPHFSLTLRDQRRQFRLYSRICDLLWSLS
jgi:triacylglycerol lipase